MAAALAREHGRHQRGSLARLQGISACRRVPRPGGLSSESVPSSAATRSASPRRPEPRAASAPPTPSSLTSTVTRPFSRRTRTVACVAREYLATFASASETTKYAALSTGSGKRSCVSASSVTGSGAREISPSSAGASPCSVRTAGWIPRASSRSSARLVWSSSCARSSSPLSSGSASERLRASRSSSARPTRRDCAPSWRSRSSRRRAASPACTSRTRDARSSSRRARSSASSSDTRLRSSPPRNANGVSPVEMNAANQAASPPPARAIVTSRNVPSAQTYTGVSWSRSSGGEARQCRTDRASTTTNSAA
jgi:hypothetical protein